MRLYIIVTERERDINDTASHLMFSINAFLLVFVT